MKTHQRRFEIERNAMKTVNESKKKEFVCERAPKLHERVRRLTEMKVNTKKPCNTWIELRGDITQIDKMIQELGMIVSGVLFSFSFSLSFFVHFNEQKQKLTHKNTHRRNFNGKE